MKDVRVYSTTYCSYCRAAKALLGERKVPYTEIDCTNDAPTRQWLVDTTGLKTVPQIFIGDVPIGGYDRLSQLDKSGKLPAVLAGDEPAPSVA